jgi:nucleotide-binding universal stress UspA family protein
MSVASTSEPAAVLGALMGSVSSHVLHHAEIAVFVAHAPKE